MKTAHKIFQQGVAQTLLICVAFSQFAQTAQAASTDLANVPMAVNNAVTPNVLVTYDNSESMDGFMSGALIAGSDPNTRGNIGRSVMRSNAITSYRNAFNWGLMTYGISDGPWWYPTWVYYLGSSGNATNSGITYNGMNFTDQCAGYFPANTTIPAPLPLGYNGPTTYTPNPLSTGSSFPATYPPIAGVSGTCTGNCGGNTAAAGVLWTYGGTPWTITNTAGYTATATWWTTTSPATVIASATWTGERCIPNPQPFSPGGAYVTYDQSSDDANIQDVLYAPGGYITNTWGVTSGAGTGYYFYNQNQNSSCATPWVVDGAGNCLSSPMGGFGWPAYFTPTDAGFLPSNPPITRQLYTPREWGYYSDITGYGTLNEPVLVDSVAAPNNTHYNNLMTLLGNETSGGTGEVKNSAVFTPLNGVLQSAKTYFSTSYQGYSSPIQYSCQLNFVMMVTDGMPTGDIYGNLYSQAQRLNPCTTTTAGNCSRDVSTASGATWTYGTGISTATATWPDTTTATWTFGTAATDAIASVTALGSTTNTPSSSGSTAKTFDIQTYIVALGDTVANANALAVMNAMAYAGGTGLNALLATDPTTFDEAIGAITLDIQAKAGSAAAVGLSSPQITSVNDASYSSNYNSGTWAGDLNAYPINLSTGQPGATSLWIAGSAATQLDLRTSVSRYIVTSKNAAGAIGGVQFQPTTAGTATTVSASQQTLLNSPISPPGPSDGAAVLAYLRGDRSGEIAGTYRQRTRLLGDIVDAEPVVVSGPSATYTDAGYKGTTATFKEVNAGRTQMIYQGANDGMLHAFYAKDGTGAANPCPAGVVCGGEEAWAYIPNLVMSTLNNYSSKIGFIHQYRVDGTPVSGDVDFSNINCLQPCSTDLSASSSNWHTILVGGLNKGGQGYYALDVTNPNPAGLTEAQVAAMVLWEFPNSANNAQTTLNTGYSFGKPVIVKTKATGWVVLVTSGYNNGTNPGDSGGDGLGHLFVLNPQTGALIKDLPTTGCTTSPAANPCGLAQLSAYVQNISTDNTTDYVYGGDLKGNVWRFDLSDPSTSNNWSVANMAVLKDSSGNTQPITTSPELSQITINGISYRYVYVGTGEYLGSSDVATTQTQTMYGLVDPKTRSSADCLNSTQQPSLPNGSLAMPTCTPALTWGQTPSLRSSLIQQTMTLSTGAASSTGVDPTKYNGWYVDLQTSGERLYTSPLVANGLLSFTTGIPSATPCQPGGSSLLYSLNYQTGGTYTNPTTGVTAQAVSNLGGALASRPVFILLPSGTVVELVRMSGTPVGSGVPGIPNNPNLSGIGMTKGMTAPFSYPPPPGKRTSWRQLVQ